MGLRSRVLSFYALSSCAKFGGPILGHVFWLTLFASLFSSSVFSAGAVSPNLSWVEEDGSDLSVDWRTSSSWVWRNDQFSLQLWIEVPSDLIEDQSNDSETNKDLQISNGGGLAPFKLRPDHLFIVTHMKGPTQLIKLKSTNGDRRVRALKIEIPFSRTTWMRHSSCFSPAPYLAERSRQGQGPFFLALRCGSEARKQKSIQVQVSEEAHANLQPVAPATLKGRDTIVLTPEKGAPSPQPRSQQLLANIEVHDQQGSPLAEFELRRTQAPVNAPTARLTSAGPSHKFTLGLNAMILEAEFDDSSGEHHYGGVDPALSLGWHWEELTGDLSTELRLPFTFFNDRLQNEVASSAWLRTIKQTRSSPRSEIQRVWGLQATSLRVHDVDTGSRVWLSPALGVKVQRGNSDTEWTFLFFPFAVGAGSEGWARAQINVRGEFTVAKLESLALKAQVEGTVLRSFGNGSDGWATSGVDFGMRGEF